MNIGFYYHVEAVFNGNGSVRVPAFLGKFIAEMARQAGWVTFFAHESEDDGTQDFIMPEELVCSVSLGPKRSAPARTFNPGKALSPFYTHLNELDVMLIRGPSPLLPAIAKLFQNRSLALLIVNDYLTGIQYLPQALWRKSLIGWWAALNAWQQGRFLKRSLVLVNSAELLEKFTGKSPNLKEVFTSSISETDFVNAVCSEVHKPVRLLYAGRIDQAKGLLELVEALSILLSRGFDAILEIAGWISEMDPTFHRLNAMAETLGVAERVRFKGYLKAGTELVSWMQAGDIFVLPSYAEGFPRAILDAMAAGLPVVASHVGGIPHRLVHNENVYLIKPRSSNAIADAVEQLVLQEELRKKIAENGLSWARRYTLQKSCSLIIEELKDWLYQ